MKVKYFLLGALSFGFLCEIFAQDASTTKRRKLRKKPTDETNSTQPALTFDDKDIKPSPLEMESDSSDERSGRGYNSIGKKLHFHLKK